MALLKGYKITGKERKNMAVLLFHSINKVSRPNCVLYHVDKRCGFFFNLFFLLGHGAEIFMDKINKVKIFVP